MYIFYFQDPVNSHKKFILECYKRLEVSNFPLTVPLVLLGLVIFLSSFLVPALFENSGTKMFGLPDLSRRPELFYLCIILYYCLIHAPEIHFL